MIRPLSIALVLGSALLLLAPSAAATDYGTPPFDWCQTAQFEVPASGPVRVESAGQCDVIVHCEAGIRRTCE